MRLPHLLFAAVAGLAPDLNGTGSTFAGPLYARWTADYAVATGAHVRYVMFGSGAGINRISDMTVDFGAADYPMTDEQMARARGGPLMHIPTAIGADAIIYNLPGVTTPLRLTGELLADIFLGKVARWDAAPIAELNPGVALPAMNMAVVHRSDAYGTTLFLTDYLTKVSQSWASGPGKGLGVNWPVGKGVKGNAAVANEVGWTPGAIGYVELAYARRNKMSVAAIRNAAGVFVLPSAETMTAAADGVASGLPASTDWRISIANAPGLQAYPISFLTWILAYRRPADAETGRSLVSFLRWGLSDGQAVEASLDYAPLPEAMLARVRAGVDPMSIR